MTRRSQKRRRSQVRRIGRSKTKAHREANAPRRSKAMRRPKRYRPLTASERERLQPAIREMHEGESLNRTARLFGMTPRRLRNILQEAKLITRRKRLWKLRKDAPTRMLFFSKGEAIYIIPADRKNRSAIGKYMNVVKALLRTNKSKTLPSYRGKFVIDVTSEKHPYEADEATLYRLNPGSNAFDEFYSIGIFNNG
jgi:hypothetical protein